MIKLNFVDFMNGCDIMFYSHDFEFFNKNSNIYPNEVRNEKLGDN